MTFYALAPRIATERDRQAAIRHSGLVAERSTSVDALVTQAAELFDARMGLATVVTARKVVVIADHGHAFHDIDRDISFCSHVVAHPDRVTCVLDAAQDLRFAGHPLVRGVPLIRFYIGAPLIGPCGAALGALCAIDNWPRTEVSADQEQALQALAVRVTAGLIGH